MLNTLAVSNYRSLRNLVIPLGQLSVLTGSRLGDRRQSQGRKAFFERLVWLEKIREASHGEFEEINSQGASVTS